MEPAWRCSSTAVLWGAQAAIRHKPGAGGILIRVAGLSLLALPRNRWLPGFNFRDRQTRGDATENKSLLGLGNIGIRGGLET